MKLKALSTAMILATVPMTGAFAAALDRSGQSIAAFLQPGNYFEAGISVLDADVSGTTSAALGSQATGDMASSYYFPTAALKIQATDQISVGLLYDQPFGAKAEYSAPNPAVSAFSFGEEGTSAEVHSDNLTLLFGFQPNANWNFYAGPVWQQVKGDVHLRGLAYSSFAQGYDADMSSDDAFGWAAGFAYQIPEIALKASLTYRSEIDHDLKTKESAANPMVNAGLGMAKSDNTTVTTPQSVNLDLQSGIMADTVAFLNVRWVNWDGFSITPPGYGFLLSTQPTRLADTLVEYNKDQWNATAGVGRKLNDKWAGNVSVGWDSGAGNPVSTLGPIEGYWNVGLGVQYSPAPNYFIAGGVKYFWLGDSKALTPMSNDVGNFEDNDAIGYGLKIGYRF
ncbi:OmpP1/FadL family transporter [Acinetobacter towneri]|uniref:OmpP1/FadL family transporter n=1 Tax=Acinetobacter towneri TaxID=202956 RepID=UPI00209AC64E|nr:outer membrane protein transport protein [Acinetobacter towneri]MCO8057061.1 outer membrane protein transport protein [Acinetobacter towneri]